METDADRLASIQALGGQLVRVDTGTFWAIFDREYLEAVGTETRSPVLTARASDVERHTLRKGTEVTVGTEKFKVLRVEPDGAGMSMVYL